MTRQYIDVTRPYIDVSGSCWKVIYKNRRFWICRDTVVIEKRVSTVMSIVLMIVILYI